MVNVVVAKPVVQYRRSQTTVGRSINKWGMPAVLRRAGAPDRWIMMAFMEWTPQERMGQPRNPLDRKVVMSTIDVKIPPDYMKDRLITFVQPLGDPPVEDEELKIVEPAGKLAPGPSVIYWSLAVRK